jgi:DNA-binding response OmpR family regulator
VTEISELNSAQLARRAFPGGGELLPLENPDSQHVKDARHWMTIYGELVEFKVGLVHRVRQSVLGLSAEARSEAEQSDIGALTEQKGRYQTRLEFWQARYWQLQGLNLDPGMQALRHQGKEVQLTRRECQLLSFLLASPGEWFTSAELAKLAWRNQKLAPEQVRTYISRLRQKLGEVDAPCELATRARRGYGLQIP